MLVRFFLLLKSAGVPVSITELLTLLEALKAGLAEISAERFYYLARTCLIKDERHYDRFDRAFAAHFKGAEDLFKLLSRELPADWLEKMAGGRLVDAGSADVGTRGGWGKLKGALEARHAAQQGRPQRRRTALRTPAD